MSRKKQKSLFQVQKFVYVFGALLSLFRRLVTPSLTLGIEREKMMDEKKKTTKSEISRRGFVQNDQKKQKETFNFFRAKSAFLVKNSSYAETFEILFFCSSRSNKRVVVTCDQLTVVNFLICSKSDDK